MRFPTKQQKPSTESVSDMSESGVRQNGNLLYFPPPPTSEIDPRPKSSRKSKPPPLSQTPMRTPTTPFPPRRSSLRQKAGYPTQSRRKRLQEVHLPDISLSPRSWLLVSLLLLSFIVLILGFIFADCVALPHTDRADGKTSDDIPIDNVTLYIRQTNTTPPPTTSLAPVLNNSPTPSSENRTNPAQGAGNGATSDLAGNPPPPPAILPPSQTNATTTPGEFLANESKRLGFDSPKNLAILFFYTATLPLLTILYTLSEMLMLFCAKRRSNASSQNDNDDDDDDLKPLTLAQKHNLNSKPKSSLAPMISLIASLLLIAGWIAINAIQAHCEIPIPAVRSAALANPENHAQMICPIQIRGHFMHGIHELSIVKNVFGWILVAVYFVYVGLCVRNWGANCKTAKQERQAIEIEGRREEMLRGSIVRFSLKGEEKSKGVRVGVTEV